MRAPRVSKSLLTECVGINNSSPASGGNLVVTDIDLADSGRSWTQWNALAPGTQLVASNDHICANPALPVGAAEWDVSFVKGRPGALYVEIQVRGIKLQETEAVNNTETPSWNETLQILGNPDITIGFRIKQKSTDPAATEDTDIGGTSEVIADLLATCAGDETAALVLELQAPGSEDPEMGILTVKLCTFAADEVAALGRSQLQSFNRAGDLQQIHDAIANLRRAVELTLNSDIPACAYHMTNLGIAQQARFQRLGELPDLEDSLASVLQAVEMTGAGDSAKLQRLSNLGRARSLRFERLGDLNDLRRAISHYREVISLVSPNDPDRPGFLSNLGAAQITQFARLGKDADLEDAIGNLSEAADLTSDNHPSKPVILLNLGNTQRKKSKHFKQLSDLQAAKVNLQRAAVLISAGRPEAPIIIVALGEAYQELYEHSKVTADLDNAIHNFQEAVRIVGDRHPRRVDFLAKLGRAQQARFRRLNDVLDLEKALRSIGQAVELSGSQPIYLKDLAGCLYDRFSKRGELRDLETAILCLQTALASLDHGSPERLAFIADLADARRIRFERVGGQSGINDAIADLVMVIEGTRDGDIEKPARHLALGSAHLVRFVRMAEERDLDDSIVHFESARRLTDEKQPDMPHILCNLGVARRTRFEQLGEIDDLRSSISILQRALELMDNGNAVMPLVLTNIANAYQNRFNRLGDTEDINRAFENMRDALQLLGDGRPDRPDCLADLGNILYTRYEHGARQLSDLESAVLHLQQAVNATDRKYPKMPVFLSRLSTVQRARFESLGDVSDLHDALSTAQHAVDLIDDMSPLRATLMSRLGYTQIVAFKRSSDVTLLESAVTNLEEAVSLTSAKNSQRPPILKNLSIALRNRFEFLGSFADLEHAISALDEALCNTEEGSPSRLELLENLASSQRIRFEHLGELQDLENAIHNFHKVVKLATVNHPDKCGYLLNLGTAQIIRYSHLGDLPDLDNSIHNMREAVHLKLDHHREQHVLFMNLGIGFLTRFQRTRELPDLDASILNFNHSIAATTQGHSDEPKIRANLGTALRNRFEVHRQMGDLENAIHNVQHAITLTEKGNLYRADLLTNLGILERSYYLHTDNFSRLENAITSFREAVQLAGPEGPSRPTYLWNLGLAQHDRYGKFGDGEDYTACLDSFKNAALLSDVSPRYALASAREWAKIAQHSGDYISALEGYRIALDILPQLAWLGLGIPSRQDWLLREKAEDLGCLSATCAIRLGRFEEAVELLDLGRSVLWQQSSALRSDFQKLAQTAPELARELHTVSQQLDMGNFHSDPSTLPTADFIGSSREESSRKRRKLVGAWEELLKRVRQLPDFGYFLRPTPFRQLRQSISQGKVIVINVSELGVDALVFDSVHPIQHVPLPNVDHSTLADLSYDMISKRPALSTKTQQTQYIRRYMTPALRTIWSDIICPVFDDIQIPTKATETPPQLRIWWYPTGPLSFLPIHAAGPGGSTDVTRLVVSSYITTLQSFFQMSTQRGTVKLSSDLKFLAISQPETPGQGALPSAKVEVEQITQALLTAGGSKEVVTHLTGSEATVSRVSSALDTCTWVHFACHGLQHPTSGMKSAFALHDGLLELDAIASKRISSGQFAFLSVCQAATGLRELPGEAMHLAAGLQFAGFSSVIATLWSICDEDAPLIAAHAYLHLFRNGVSGIDSSDAATALNRAVLALRQDHTVTVDRWAPFVHFGI